VRQVGGGRQTNVADRCNCLGVEGTVGGGMGIRQCAVLGAVVAADSRMSERVEFSLACRTAVQCH